MLKHMEELKLGLENEKALMIQLNAEIEKAAEGMASAVITETVRINYPPNGGLSDDETKALKEVKNIPHIESALRKIIASSSAAAAFHFLNSIDGTGAPDSKFGKWTEVFLIDRPSGDNPSVPMLHDSLYETYWDWKKLRGEKDWSLDNLPE